MFCHVVSSWLCLPDHEHFLQLDAAMLGYLQHETKCRVQTELQFLLPSTQVNTERGSFDSQAITRSPGCSLVLDMDCPFSVAAQSRLAITDLHEHDSALQAHIHQHVQTSSSKHCSSPFGDHPRVRQDCLAHPGHDLQIEMLPTTIGDRHDGLGVCSSWFSYPVSKLSDRQDRSSKCLPTGFTPGATALYKIATERY